MSIIKKDQYRWMENVHWFGPFDAADYEHLQSSEASSSSSTERDPLDKPPFQNDEYGLLMLPVVPDKDIIIDNIWIRLEAEGTPIAGLTTEEWSSSSSGSEGSSVWTIDDCLDLAFFRVNNCQTALAALMNAQMVTEWVDLCRDVTPNCMHELTIYDRRSTDIPTHLPPHGALYANAGNLIEAGGLLMPVILGGAPTGFADMRIGIRWRDYLDGGGNPGGWS